MVPNFFLWQTSKSIKKMEGGRMCKPENSLCCSFQVSVIFQGGLDVTNDICKTFHSNIFQFDKRPHSSRKDVIHDAIQVANIADLVRIFCFLQQLLLERHFSCFCCCCCCCCCRFRRQFRCFKSFSCCGCSCCFVGLCHFYVVVIVVIVVVVIVVVVKQFKCCFGLIVMLLLL